MTILEAAQETNVLTAALMYLENGLSVLPVKGKENTVRWAKFQVERATPGLVHWWHTHDKLSGVAVICGKVSGNLVVMDLDGEAACEQYELTFPHLLNTLTIRTGSGKGKHFYYFTKELMPTTRTKGFELRSDGCYVVAPPSLHPVTSLAYGVARTNEPLYLDNLNEVRRWIIGEIQSKPRSQQSAAANGGTVKTHRYAAAALRYECENVQRATLGSANSTLYRAALKLGNFVALNMIARSEVENALLSAAAELSSRDGDGASWRTIQSGLNTGMAKGKR